MASSQANEDAFYCFKKGHSGATNRENHHFEVILGILAAYSKWPHKIEKKSANFK